MSDKDQDTIRAQQEHIRRLQAAQLQDRALIGDLRKHLSAFYSLYDGPMPEGAEEQIQEALYRPVVNTEHSRHRRSAP